MDKPLLCSTCEVGSCALYTLSKKEVLSMESKSHHTRYSKGEILTKIGRTIGREFDEKGIESTDDFLTKLQQFLEENWAITDNAKVGFVKNENGDIIKLTAKQDSCKMCYANTYYKLHDTGTPSCMFPQVMMGILSKVKNQFHFKNLRFEGVQKGGVGECEMTWNVK